MKKVSWITALIAVAIFLVPFLGCQRMNPADPTIPFSDGEIQIRVLGKVAADKDTINTEKYLRMVFTATSNVAMVSIQWTFSDGQQASGSPAEYYCQGDPGTVVSVTVIGVDQNSTPHSATIYLKVVNSLDGLPGFFIASCTPAAGGTFNLVLLASKKPMAWHSGSYGYTGNITSTSPWPVYTIPAADTNFNWINGRLVAAEAGSIGKFVAVRINVGPGNYQVPIGRINGGQLVWDTFWGDYPDNKFTVQTNGITTPGTSTVLLGTNGDSGDNPTIRFDLKENSIVLYTNNGVDFSSCRPYVQLQDSSGEWKNHYSESSVPGFPNWGKIEIDFKDFLIPGLLVFRYGTEISNPAGSVADMSQSDYYDWVFKVLKIRIITTALPKKFGG